MQPCLKIIYIFFMSLFFCFSAKAESNDRIFELGAGLGVARFDHYIGSDQSKNYFMPFPYIYYRSKNFTVDRESIKGKTFFNDNFKLGVDFGARLPVKSKDNFARKGMPDLKLVTYIGPSIEFCIKAKCDEKNNFKIHTSILKPLIIDASEFNDLDWLGKIGAKYSHTLWSDEQKGNMELLTQFNLNFQGEKFSNYYYAVENGEELSNRSLYSTNSGFAGYNFSAGTRWRINQWWLGAFVNYYDINDAKFSDSPLVKKESNWQFALAFSYVFNL